MQTEGTNLFPVINDQISPVNRRIKLTGAIGNDECGS